MADYTFYIKYRVNGVLYGTSKEHCIHYTLDKHITDNAVKITINPKPDVKMELVELKLSSNRTFVDGDRFFANGYQAWTTSREYTVVDKLRRPNPIYKALDIASKFIATSSDFLFFEPEKKAGCFHSYTYTYIRNDEKVDFFGSLSDRFAYTIFSVDMKNDTFVISKDVEGKTIDSSTVLFDLLTVSGSYDEVFEKYFNAMNLPKCKIDHMSGYTSWYNYFAKIDENIILRDLNGLDRAKDEVTIFQIDDGYQVTTGDWIENEKFPHGMRYVVDAIHEKGYQAGLWVAPFNVTKKSTIYKEHKDWLIKDINGKSMYTTIAWHGGYCMDIYVPGVKEYIKSIFDRVLNEWNFDMVKLDFLYSQCVIPRNNKTRSEIMYEAMEFLRECVGDKLLLGCGVPLAPCFGVVDACRISCDVSWNYSDKFLRLMNINRETPSAINAMLSTLFRRHLNGNAFVNDPDVFFLRDINIKFTEDQKLLLAFINNLMGDVLFVSDNAGDFSDEKIELLKLFFKKNSKKIYSVSFVGKDDIEVVFGEENNKQTLKFNIMTGVSNVRELLINQ